MHFSLRRSLCNRRNLLMIVFISLSFHRATFSCLYSDLTEPDKISSRAHLHKYYSAVGSRLLGFSLRRNISGWWRVNANY
jgi:hypothetical protein